VNPELQITDDQRQAVEEFRKRHRTAMLALLFTDIERSTALRNEMGELPASALLARHNALVRALLAEFSDAQEISTAGDSFFIVFAKPSDAVRFALLAQRRLRELAAQARPDFRVRMGIHLGEVVVQEEAAGGTAHDVLGMQVDLAARVTALTDGGQILMTRGVFDNARQILKGQLLPGIGDLRWLNHGLYFLKGFDDAVEVCEVGEAAVAPLRQPADCPAAQRATVPGSEPVLGWRPAVEQAIPGTEWVLEEKLGEGGFGEVWLARHRRTKELRVFKFCFRADRLRSLKREMTLFRIIREVLGERPDIARLYNVQFEEAPYYLELEYTPGGNLADWLARKAEEQTTKTPRHKEDSLVSSCLGGEIFASAVPLSLRLEIVAQIATALAAAHSVGVIHKDVKPSNILIEERKDGAPAASPVSKDGALAARRCSSIQVRLTDFGIGQLLDREALERAGITATGFTETASAMTGLSSRTGTRLYMAPELLAGRPPSIQSDIYSLGVLLYQMIIGDLSQPMTTDWERHVPDPLLRDDLRHCLAGDPSDRFPSADDLAHRLRTVRRRRTQRRVTSFVQAAAALFAVLVLAVGGYSWVQFYRMRQTELILAQRDVFWLQSEVAKAKYLLGNETYFSNIALATDHVEALTHARAREILALCPRQLRNWEWGRLQYLCQSESPTSIAYYSGTSFAAFSPDGRWLLTGSPNQTATVWDAESGRELVTLRGHARDVVSASFSPDARRIITASLDQTAKTWDVETGREILTIKGLNGPRPFAAFSPDGKRLLTGICDIQTSGAGAKVCDAETGLELLTIRESSYPLRCAAFSRNGRWIATGSDGGTVRLWDSQSGNELYRFGTHTRIVHSVSFTSDSRRVLSASGDGTAKTWLAEPALNLLTLKGHNGEVLWAGFSSDGRRIVSTGRDRMAKIWDTETGRELLTLKGHRSSVLSGAWSPNGKRLVTVSEREAIIWDTLPWRDEDLPGDAKMSYDERIQLYKIEQWKKRQQK
jgi:WD40 repeat protein/serine/threonine protein kinase/class 3 adenylate cyclase